MNHSAQRHSVRKRKGASANAPAQMSMTTFQSASSLKSIMDATTSGRATTIRALRGKNLSFEKVPLEPLKESAAPLAETGSAHQTWSILAASVSYHPHQCLVCSWVDSAASALSLLHPGWHWSLLRPCVEAVETQSRFHRLDRTKCVKRPAHLQMSHRTRNRSCRLVPTAQRGWPEPF